MMAAGKDVSINQAAQLGRAAGDLLRLLQRSVLQTLAIGQSCKHHVRVSSLS